MGNRNYVPLHKVRRPCLECGHDIMHDGVSPRRCEWHWHVKWQGTWYQIGLAYTIDAMDGTKHRG